MLKFITLGMFLFNSYVYADVDGAGSILSSSIIRAGDLNTKFSQLDTALTGRSLLPTSPFKTYNVGDTLNKQELLDELLKIPSEIALGSIPSLGTQILSSELNAMFDHLKTQIEDHCIPSDVLNSTAVTGKISTGCTPTACIGGYVVSGNSCIVAVIEPTMVSDIGGATVDDFFETNTNKIIYEMNNTIYFQSPSGVRYLDPLTGQPTLLSPVSQFDSNFSSLYESFMSGGNLYTRTVTYIDTEFTWGPAWVVIRPDNTTDLLLPQMAGPQDLGFDFNGKPIFVGTPVASYTPVGGPTGGVLLGAYYHNNTLNGIFTANPVSGDSTYFLKTNTNTNVLQGNDSPLITSFRTSTQYAMFRARGTDDVSDSLFRTDNNGNILKLGITGNINGIYKVCGDFAIFSRAETKRIDLQTGTIDTIATYLPDSTLSDGLDDSKIFPFSSSCLYMVNEDTTPGASGGLVQKIMKINKTGSHIVLDTGVVDDSSFRYFFKLRDYLYYTKKDVFGKWKLTRVHSQTGVVEQVGTPSSPIEPNDDLIVYFKSSLKESTLTNSHESYVEVENGRAYFNMSGSIWMIDTNDVVSFVTDLIPGVNDWARHFTEHNGFIYFASIEDTTKYSSPQIINIYRMLPDGTNIEVVYEDIRTRDDVFDFQGVKNDKGFFFKALGNLYFIAHNENEKLKLYRLDDVTASETTP